MFSFFSVSRTSESIIFFISIIFNWSLDVLWNVHKINLDSISSQTWKNWATHLRTSIWVCRNWVWQCNRVNPASYPIFGRWGRSEWAPPTRRSNRRRNADPDGGHGRNCANFLVSNHCSTNNEEKLKRTFHFNAHSWSLNRLLNRSIDAQRTNHWCDIDQPSYYVN